MAKISRKQGKVKHKILETEEPVLSPEERSFEAILQNERTKELNSEGYHFIRPKWHRFVYGGGKQDEKD